MDHSHMDHSHMGHGGMDMDMTADRCSMNMLFTWDTNNLCIVFRWWHVRGPLSLVVSLLAIVALTSAYEALRALSRRYETFAAKRQDEVPKPRAPPTELVVVRGTITWQYGDREAETFVNGVPVTENTPFLWSGRNQVEVSQRAHVIKALFYAVQTFYAFMLMLLFMTYNGWVMAAMTLGAFLGYLLFGNSTSATKDSACH